MTPPTSPRSGSLPIDVASNTTPYIRADGLSASYGEGELRVPVIQDASFQIHQGRLTVIRGRSGSGKTTLLSLLGGLDRPDAGSIVVDQRDITTLGRQALNAYRRTHVGFVFQSFHLLPTLTALENVETGLEPLRLAHREIRAMAEAALDAVALADKADRFPHQLSGGEQQRVAVARACAKNPPLLLADEPTGNLDQASGSPVLDLIVGQAGRGETPRTVVIVTHDRQVAARADDVLEVAAHRVHVPS